MSKKDEKKKKVVYGMFYDDGFGDGDYVVDAESGKVINTMTGKVIRDFKDKCSKKKANK